MKLLAWIRWLFHPSAEHPGRPVIIPPRVKPPKPSRDAVLADMRAHLLELEKDEAAGKKVIIADDGKTLADLIREQVAALERGDEVAP